MPDEKWGEAVKAVVVLKGGPQGHRGGDHRLLQGNIAHYKAPKSVDFIRELPKTASGKIHKKGLRDQYWGKKGKKVSRQK
jgi:fatty-acyl-CoA synthase